MDESGPSSRGEALRGDATQHGVCRPDVPVMFPLAWAAPAESKVAEKQSREYEKPSKPDVRHLPLLGGPIPACPTSPCIKRRKEERRTVRRWVVSAYLPGGTYSTSMA